MIGTLKESSLHASLKQVYQEPGDIVEKSVGKYVIDIVRDNLLIEIQTKNFAAIRKKLENLLQSYRVLLIYPIIKDTWITNYEATSNNMLRRRLSPRHYSFISVFRELIYISDLIPNPNLILEVILIQAEEIRVDDGLGSWRRKGWSIHDRKLLKILDQRIYSNPKQFLAFFPESMITPFTNQKLARELEISINIARMMTYSFRKMNLLKVVKKVRNEYLFEFN
jgi:hypothetical protein